VKTLPLLVLKEIGGPEGRLARGGGEIALASSCKTRRSFSSRKSGGWVTGVERRSRSGGGGSKGENSNFDYLDHVRGDTKGRSLRRREKKRTMAALLVRRRALSARFPLKKASIPPLRCAHLPEGRRRDEPEDGEGGMPMILPPKKKGNRADIARFRKGKLLRLRRSVSSREG